jgi:hypothetical protein
MQPKIELVKTRDFGEIINDTFTFIGQNWKPLLKAFAIICGFFIVANLVIALLQQQKVIEAVQTTSYPTKFGRFSTMFGPTYILSSLFTLLTYTAIALIPLCFMSLYKEKGNVAPETEEVWGYFKYYFLKALGIELLTTLCLLAGFVLCVIPGFYILPILSLILPVIVIENTGLGNAWSKSFQLIKENWWQTFGAIIVILIITYAAMMVFIIPVSILSVGTMFISKSSQPSSVGLILTTIISAFCQVFLMLPTVTAALCYFNLNEKLEGTGLMNRINNFGNNDLDTGLPKEEY